MTDHNLVAESAAVWRRVHPAAIALITLRIIWNTVQHGWQGLAPLGVLLATNGLSIDIIELALMGAAVLALVFGVLNYLMFRFRLDGTKVLIRKGVFTRSKLDIGYERIQSLRINTPLLLRPFGLVELGAETAGSSKEEISLPGLSRKMAETIRSEVLDYQSRHAPQTADTGVGTSSNATSEQRLLFAAERPQLIKYALSSNTIWITLGLLASFVGSQWDSLEGPVVKSVLSGLKVLFGEEEVPPLFIALLIVGGLISVLILFSLFHTFWRYHGFKLWANGDRVERKSGLVAKTEDSLKRSKIQCLAVGQNIFALGFGVSHMRLVQAGETAAGEAGQSRAFLIPSLERPEEQSLVREFLGDTHDLDTDLKRISSGYLRRPLILVLGLAILTAVGLAALWKPWVAWAAIAPTVLLVLTLVHYTRIGYRFGDRLAQVNSGTLGRTRTFFEIRKVQHAKLTTTRHQRRLGLATLTLSLAGKSVSIPYMNAADARQIINRVLYAVETSKEPWM